MLKRLIGVITVKDGWAVQSMGYGRYLPLGRPEILAENYDRWFLDEILILSIDRTPKGLGPDFETIRKIGSRRLVTPLAYGGGISNAAQALDIVHAGADRLCCETAFDADSPDKQAQQDALEAIRDAVGIQAMLRVMPLEKADDGTIVRFDYRSRETRPLEVAEIQAQSSLFSELILVDRRGEGGLVTFDLALLEPFAGSHLQIIAFGGITERDQVAALLGRDGISAVAVGNSLSYREMANRNLIAPGSIDDTRFITYGVETRGARQW